MPTAKINSRRRWPLWLAVFAALAVPGCQSYSAEWTDPQGKSVRISVDRALTDTKAGLIEFNPQTGALHVENLDSQTKLAEAVAALAQAVAATKGGAP